MENSRQSSLENKDTENKMNIFLQNLEVGEAR